MDHQENQSQEPASDEKKRSLLQRFFRGARIFSSILTLNIIAVAIAIAILFAVGIKPFVVITGSMEPAIHIGSICFVNENVDFESIQTDDVISFRAGKSTMVTHRVIEVTPEGLTTKGDANNTTDVSQVTKENYVGKIVFNIPKAGRMMLFLQNQTGRILVGTLIIVLLLLSLMPDEDESEDDEENSEIDADEESSENDIVTTKKGNDP